MLLAKLPGNTKKKRVRHVLSIRRRQSREPDLVYFNEFVKDETLLVNDPYSESQQLISIVRDHQKAHNKIPSIKETG